LVANESLDSTNLCQTIVIPEQPGWMDTLILIASQVLQRCVAIKNARLLAEAHASAEREATLGRYVLETRHTVNNALTSVLGNAELLLLNGNTLPSDARLQIETIRNMALRIHENMQRFSSLEKELNAVAKISRMKSQAASASA
jgi:signal transduction histidine kinase